VRKYSTATNTNAKEIVTQDSVIPVRKRKWSPAIVETIKMSLIVDHHLFPVKILVAKY
jgi:hypothetical protein